MPTHVNYTTDKCPNMIECLTMTPTRVALCVPLFLFHLAHRLPLWVKARPSVVGNKNGGNFQLIYFFSAFVAYGRLPVHCCCPWRHFSSFHFHLHLHFNLYIPSFSTLSAPPACLHHTEANCNYTFTIVILPAILETEPATV